MNIKRILAAALAALMAALSITAALPVLAIGKAAPKYPTPEGYDDHDYQAVLGFLETADENGVKNGDKLSVLSNKDYDPEDPSTWEFGTHWGEHFGVVWTESTPRKLKEFNCRTSFIDVLPLVGELDLSQCTALEALDCDDNDITYLSVAGCTALRELKCCTCPLNDAFDHTGCVSIEKMDCGYCGLTWLDVSDMPLIYRLECQGNNIVSLNVSGCSRLEEIGCGWNCLESLDLSGMPGLYRVDAEGMRTLSRVNVSNCPKLGVVNVEYSWVEELNYDNCPELSCLNCQHTYVTSLDLSGHAKLKYLICDALPLTSIDVTGCPLLEELYCSETNITELDLSHCPNLFYVNTLYTNIRSFDLTGNPLINFERVDSEGDGYVAIYNYWEDAAGYVFANARAGENSKFVGWYDENGELITTNKWLDTEGEFLGAVTARFVPKAIAQGDANCDGKVDSADALLILRYALGLGSISYEGLAVCDINGDGSVDSQDALAILRMALR